MKYFLNRIINLLDKKRNINREKCHFNLPWSISLSLGAKNDFKDLMIENSINVNKAKRVLPFNDKEFKEWVLPVVEYVAKYYLYLPANNEHYNKAGGSFEYSINSAIHAVMLMEKNLGMYSKIAGEFRHQYKMTCPLSVFLFALIHATGKPISEYKVFASDKNKTINTSVKAWDPLKETLYDWVTINKVQYYYSCYNSDTIAKNHQSYIGISLSRLDPIIDSFRYSKLLKKQLNEMLCKSDDQLTHEMLNIVKAGIMNSEIHYSKLLGHK